MSQPSLFHQLPGPGHNSSLMIHIARASLVSQTLKHLPAMWETQVLSLGWEDHLE